MVCVIDPTVLVDLGFILDAVLIAFTRQRKGRVLLLFFKKKTSFELEEKQNDIILVLVNLADQ